MNCLRGEAIILIISFRWYNFCSFYCTLWSRCAFIADIVTELALFQVGEPYEKSLTIKSRDEISNIAVSNASVDYSMLLLINSCQNVEYEMNMTITKLKELKARMYQCLSKDVIYYIVFWSVLYLYFIFYNIYSQIGVSTYFTDVDDNSIFFH